jgi:hypothetical protein
MLGGGPMCRAGIVAKEVERCCRPRDGKVEIAD